MPTFSRVRRKRGPALSWAPTQDSYYELAQILRREGRLPLYLTQAAILDFEAHLRESSLPLPFGLLAGDICICPDTKLEYLLVDTAVRARVELGEDDPYAQLAEELQALVAEQTKRRKLAIGWYLGGLANDLTLDDDVTRLHGQLFPERWQVALVRGADSGAERGAFLRYESIWSRWYAIPFFEFHSERAGHKKGEVGTAIRWENYRADEPVRPLDELEANVRRADAVPRPSWGARLFGTSLSPLRRGGRGMPGPVPDRTRAASVPARQQSSNVAQSQTTGPSAAALPTVKVPSSRSDPLQLTPSPLRSPDRPPVQPAERKPAAFADQTLAAPIEQTLPAPVEQRVTTPVEQRVTAPVEQKVAAPVEQKVTAPVEQRRAAAREEEVTTPAELRVAPTRELQAASTVELQVAAPEEVKLAPDAEARVAAMVGGPVASPAGTLVAAEEPQPEVQHVFIDGSLVPAPVAYEFFQKPGMLPSPDRVSVSSFVVGALLLLILVLLYLIAS